MSEAGGDQPPATPAGPTEQVVLNVPLAYDDDGKPKPIPSWAKAVANYLLSSISALDGFENCGLDVRLIANMYGVKHPYELVVASVEPTSVYTTRWLAKTGDDMVDAMNEHPEGNDFELEE